MPDRSIYKHEGTGTITGYWLTIEETSDAPAQSFSNHRHVPLELFTRVARNIRE